MDEKIRVPGIQRAMAPLGVGTWQWGDRTFWRYGREYGRREVGEAFEASLAAGVDLFDTAEIYGRGVSERVLGECVRRAGRPVVVASKYMPFPNRVRGRSVGRAAAASLERLGLPRIDLYQVHMPFPFPRLAILMDELVALAGQGRIGAVGVSNYPAGKMLRARDRLARHGVPLASNQVNYSLLRRRPESDGTLAACREAGVVLIAYSPLAQGLLSGKFHQGGRVDGFRRYRRPFHRSQIDRSRPVIATLKEISARHSATPAQVALRWLIQKGNVLPIPGAKNRTQAEENAGALRLRLVEAEMNRLDEVSRPWL